MKIGGKFSSFDISAMGLSVQRKRMNIIAENIANAETTKTEQNMPYKRQYYRITAKNPSFPEAMKTEGMKMKLNTTEAAHFGGINEVQVSQNKDESGLKYELEQDNNPGEKIFMPNHPDADEQGYVEMSNVNIITEMVDMISATRSYEANLTALNAAKQMAKDSLEI
jgi:flagellar basal-body rod protein FlgC